jgi:hypothetical protein
MEITCSRCHQPVEEDSCYCPSCGLPQLVYSSEPTAGPAQPEKWTEAVTDAGVVAWRPALRAAIFLAIPAGVLSSGVSRAGGLGLFWMMAAAAWAVTIYSRRQRPAWITAGAGARIGLVTGLLAAAMAFATTGVALFSSRFVLHQGSAMDNEWRAFVDAVVTWSQQILTQMGVADQGQSAMQKSLMLSPEGHAAYATLNIAGNDLFLVLFAMAGGALGARLLRRSRRPQA